MKIDNVNTCFRPADILLPDFDKVDGTKWSCIACDQYTSSPDYWKKVSELVGEYPSTLKLTLPEIWLSQSDVMVPNIQNAMNQAEKDCLVNHPDTMILLKRKLQNGQTRLGLIGCIDLEAYSYEKQSKTLIRATEETVPERIPPRMKIRRGAPIELPHVMLLIDDPSRTVIEPLAQSVGEENLLYSYPLMMNGGHITGYSLKKDRMNDAQKALLNLIRPGDGKEPTDEPLLFAVGDGNHSLATAKACWEEIKQTLSPEQQPAHLARYALAEVVNLYDESLTFEPIYRVIFGLEPALVLRDFDSYAKSLSGTMPPQKFRLLYSENGVNMTRDIVIERPEHPLPVGSVQNFVKQYLSAHPEADVDYIHDEKQVNELSSQKNTVGFVFEGMKKDELFPAVRVGGSLPRKTFSMGHADDKRFYTEARRIIPDNQ